MESVARNLVVGNPRTALPELKWIPTKDICIDQEYQRTVLCVSRVNDIARNWSWDLCQTISVKVRGGKFYATDGQHRVKGAMKAGIPRLPCIVTNSTGMADEARTLVQINTNRSAVAAVDRFRAMVASGDDTYIKVDKMLRYQNLRISKSANGANEVAFPALVVSTFKANRHLCERALFLQGVIIGDAKEPYSQEIHKGLFYILRNITEEQMPILETAIGRVFSNGGRTALLHSIRARAMTTKSYHRHERTCALGCLEVINRGIHRKIRMNNEVE